MGREKYGEICMRLYRGFDADLLAVHESGIPVNVLAGILIDAYANGKYIRIVPETCKSYNPGARQSSVMHLQVRIRTKAGRKLVSSVRYGYRNQFSKTVVRNALAGIPFTAFFKDAGRTGTEQERLESLDVDGVVVVPPGLTQKQYIALLEGDDVPAGRKAKHVDVEKPARKKERPASPTAHPVSGDGREPDMRIGGMRSLKRPGGTANPKPDNHEAAEMPVNAAAQAADTADAGKLGTTEAAEVPAGEPAKAAAVPATEAPPAPAVEAPSDYDLETVDRMLPEGETEEDAQEKIGVFMDTFEGLVKDAKSRMHQP